MLSPKFESETCENKTKNLNEKFEAKGQQTAGKQIRKLKKPKASNCKFQLKLKSLESNYTDLFCLKPNLTTNKKN